MSEFERRQARSQGSHLVSLASLDRAGLHPAHADISPVTTQEAPSNQIAQRFAQSCPLRLPNPGRCPLGGTCHTCPARVQAKLTINEPGDPYEWEADRVAEQVMRMPEPGVPEIQRACSDCDEELQRQVEPEEEEEEEEPAQAKPLANQIMPLVQRQGEEEEDEEEMVQTKRASSQASWASVNLHTQIRALGGAGQPLSTVERNFFEPRFGRDLNQVRVHTGAKAAQAARLLGAQAYVIGRNVVFGQGQYRPGTLQGRHLLAHELAHTIQQSGNYRPVLQRRVDPKRFSDRGCRMCLEWRRIRGRRRCTKPVYLLRSVVLSMLTRADSRAIDLARRAEHFLAFQRLIYGTSLYNPNDQVIRDFRTALWNRFRLNIRNRRHRRRMRRVERRYAGVARLLESGRVRYRCGTRNIWAYVYPPRRTIYLGLRFLGSDEEREHGLTLLHEPLHILYGLGHRGWLGNIWNYERFATDMENMRIPPVTLPAGLPGSASTEPTSPQSATGTSPREEREMEPRGDNDVLSSAEVEEEENESTRP